MYDDETDVTGTRWEYLTWDVLPEHFGDVLGELNRTGWQILGSAELDEQRQPVTHARDPAGGGGVWQRIHARRQATHEWSWERARQRWG